MTFDQHQTQMAEWMGYPDANAMNADHDNLHRAMCSWLGVTSHSLLCAAGEPHDAEMAGLEEDAVLHVQRLIAHHRIEVPA